MERKSPPRSAGGHLEAILNASPHAILATDADGKITFANHKACEMAEREMRELVGSSIVTVYESLEAAREVNRQIYAHGGVIHDLESKFKTKSGRLIPIRISVSHLRDNGGKYIGSVGFFGDYSPLNTKETWVKADSLEIESGCRPVFQLYPGLSLMMGTGLLDAKFFQQATKSLLDHARSSKTRVFLIDLSGSKAKDATTTASDLLKMVRTLQLAGTECILTGLEPLLVQAIEPLTQDIHLVKSSISTDSGLETALNTIGLEIRHKS